jgi:hypothetical protein
VAQENVPPAEPFPVNRVDRWLRLKARLLLLTFLEDEIDDDHRQAETDQNVG